MTRVLFLTRSLGNGGAERQLTELVRGIDKERFEVTVATFYPGGIRWDEIFSNTSIRTVSLDKRGRWDITGMWRSSCAIAREVRPDIIYSFRYEANLIAIFLARVVGAKLVWGIRRSTKSLPLRDPIYMGILFVGAILSRFADRVVYNSYCGLGLHVKRHYSRCNALVIPNGFDTKRFRPDLEAGRLQRIAWGVNDGERLIGIVGRIDPVKDHLLFLRAASILSTTYQQVRFVVIGGGAAAYIGRLRQSAVELEISEHILWAGEGSEMVACYNALDILALCSKEEGCPNVVGEAMSCGILCTVTDVGDAARMVGETGVVVPPGDAEAMAAAWRTLLDIPVEEKRQKGVRARNHIIQGYDLEIMVNGTSALLDDLRR